MLRSHVAVDAREVTPFAARGTVCRQAVGAATSSFDAKAGDPRKSRKLRPDPAPLRYVP